MPEEPHVPDELLAAIFLLPLRHDQCLSVRAHTCVTVIASGVGRPERWSMGLSSQSSTSLLVPKQLVNSHVTRLGPRPTQRALAPRWLLGVLDLLRLAVHKHPTTALPSLALTHSWSARRRSSNSRSIGAISSIGSPPWRITRFSRRTRSQFRRVTAVLRKEMFDSVSANLLDEAIPILR